MGFIFHPLTRSLSLSISVADICFLLFYFFLRPLVCLSLWPLLTTHVAASANLIWLPSWNRADALGLMTARPHHRRQSRDSSAPAFRPNFFPKTGGSFQKIKRPMLTHVDGSAENKRMR